MDDVRELTLDAIATDPERVSRRIEPRDAEPLTLRPLASSDTELLSGFFAGLSEETRRRFAPHPFTDEEARKLCGSLNPRAAFRLIAVTDGPAPRVAGYFILVPGVRGSDAERYRARGTPLDPALDYSVAPCMADAFQGKGLGTELMRGVLGIAKRLGCRRAALLGGTQATNARAIHFYEKLGFRKVGAFRTEIDNLDMIADLL